jgi:Zn-dependent alcohol dehydrogenase
MKFKAAILTELNQPLTLGDVETTELLVGQVLVKILVSGLCGAQLQELAGEKGNANFLPHLLGHEGCGIVQEIGVGVTTVKVGDKVVMHWRKSDGIEAPFPKYIYNGKEMSSGKVTTISEYSIVSENRLTTVPDDTPDELCALLGCAMTTALGTVTNEANVKYGESVLIIGCGGLGLHLIEACKLANAFPITGLDVNDKKEDISKRAGATTYYNISKNNINDIIKDGSIDIIIDTTGNENILRDVFPKLSGSGRLILVGQPKPGRDIVIPNANKLFSGTGQTIKATQGGSTNPTEDIPRYVKLNKAGILTIKNLITHRFNLDEINDAFDMLKSGNAGRIMINVNN